MRFLRRVRVDGLTSSLAAYLACLGVITAVLFWRRPDAFYNPQFWAEDGSRFFTEAYFRGAGSLFIPFSGYYHLLARLVAVSVSVLPVRYAPAWYVFASWLLLAALVGYLFTKRFRYANRLKFLLGAALLVTAADNEVFLNLANWATLTALFWLLLAISEEPLSRIAALGDFAVLLLAGLNSPFVVCLWPLFFLRWAERRTLHSARLFWFSLAVAAVQFWNMPARITSGALLPPVNSLFVDALIYLFGFMFAGEPVFGLARTDAFRLLGLLVVLGFYILLAWHGYHSKNWPLLTILLGGLLVETLSFYVVRNDLTSPILSTGRHFYIPAVTTAWALLLARPRRAYLRWIPLTAIVVAFLLFTPASKNQVFVDLDWAGQTARCTAPDLRCRIPINPVWNPPVWFAAVDSRASSNR